MPSDYGAEGSALTQRKRVDQDHSIVFRAETIRQERTGVHARVSIACNGATLAWSNFNVERDEDRVRLANSAYKHLEHANGSGRKEELAGYPQTYLKNDLDQFCIGLWDAQLEQSMPEMMAGATERIGPTFLLRPYIVDGGGTIVFAPPGRGKSYALLLMAVSLDAGLSMLWPCQLSKVLFVNLERSASSVRQRLANVNAVLGLDRARPIPTINARGRSLMDVAAACERYIGEHEIKCVLVDSISRAGGGTLVADDTTNRICDQLNRFEIAWLGLGHTPRQDESHVYGSVFWEAAADLCVQLLSEQEDGGPLGIGLQLTKKNDVGGSAMWVGALEFDDLGLTAVRKARPHEFPGVDAGKRMTDRERIREHLLDMGAKSAPELEEELGIRRDRVARILSKDSAFVDAGRLGHQKLYGVAESGTVYPLREIAAGQSQARRSNVHPTHSSGTVYLAPDSTQLEPEELPF